MRRDRVLIVEDEPEMLDTLEEILQDLSIEIIAEEFSKDAVNRLNKESLDLVVTDIKMGEIDGFQLLKTAKEMDPDLPVILITAYPEIDSAVNALRQGAFDYLIKPFSPDEFRLSVNRALNERRLRRENRLLKRHLQHEYQSRDFIGECISIKELTRQVNQVAVTPANILITGESGTGKELIARMSHTLSNRNGNFVPIDCAAIPASLMEGELFGHEKGAYTGATTTVPGLFEFAKDGTIFLDEVCELPLEMQTKLLRVIEEKRTRRVGGREFIEVDARIIAATNRNISEEVKQARFREDLFYRLNVIHLHIPPLRERKEDIPLIIDYYIRQFSGDFKKLVSRISNEALDVILRYDWPGNVRELQNIIKRAIIFAEDGIIKTDNLPEGLIMLDTLYSGNNGDFFSVRQEEVKKFERDYFVKLLKRFNGNVNMTATEAKVPLGTAYRLLKKLQIDPLKFRA